MTKVHWSIKEFLNMKIIIEGPDNSGKSTLALYLSQLLRIPLVPGEGPARSPEEINDRVTRYNAMRGPLIFDRHPCVSQPIYNNFRDPIHIDPRLTELFYLQDVFFIYCRGRDTLEGHQVKEHDQRHDASGQRHEDLVNRYHPEICVLYDQWALDRAQLTYRIGNDMNGVARLINGLLPGFDPIADIAQFHEKFGLSYAGPARVLPKEMADFRIRFMTEELDEYAAHEARAHSERFISQIKDRANYSYHLAHMLDALVDEVYVVLGTSYLHGFDFAEAWRRVHRANMAKVRATDVSQSSRNSTLDVVKPEGWQAPDHTDLVEINDLP